MDSGNAYVESAENDFESLLRKTPQALDDFLKTFAWAERKAVVSNLVPLVGAATDPVATAAVLINAVIGAETIAPEIALATSLTHQVGLAAVVAILVEQLKDSERGGRGVAAGIFVGLMVRLGKITWGAVETRELRDRLLDLGEAHVYLADPTLDVDALLAIWRSPLSSADAVSVGAHPNATREFWRRSLENQNNDRPFAETTHGWARARAVPEVREHMFRTVMNSSIFQKCLNVPGASAELLAFALEGQFRMTVPGNVIKGKIQTVLRGNALSIRVLQGSLTRMAHDGRLDTALLDWLTQSQSGAVRQWAMLTVAPLCPAQSHAIPSTDGPTLPGPTRRRALEVCESGETIQKNKL